MILDEPYKIMDTIQWQTYWWTFGVGRPFGGRQFGGRAFGGRPCL